MSLKRSIRDDELRRMNDAATKQCALDWQKIIDQEFFAKFEQLEEMKIDDMKEKGYIYVFEEIDTGIMSHERD
jgi:hypothetical protein